MRVKSGGIRQEKSGNRKKKSGKILRLLGILLLSAVLLELIIEQSGMILFGVEVDGVSLGGCTRETARERLQAAVGAQKQDQVVLVIEETSYPYTKEELGLELDIETAVEQAYQVGRRGNLTERFKRRRDYEELSVPKSWNHETFLENLQPLINLYRVIPTGSQVRISDEQGLSIQEGENGRYLDVEALFRELETAPAGDLRIEVSFRTWYGYPEAEQIVGWQMESVLGIFATEYEEESNRGKNIERFAAALDQTLLYPYELFSVNERTGERTAAKGYLPAPVIVAGEREEDIGGGICQVVTTLYQAVKQAGFTITERHRHSLPPTYVGEGMDAAVVYGEKDFRCYHQRKAPVLLEVRAVSGDLTVIVHGNGN